MSKKINNVEEELGKTDLSAAALALYLDVNESTISKWKKHIEEPAIKTLDEVGEVLEIDNSELLLKNNRANTGLANALQKKYKQILKDGVAKKIESTDSKGKPIMVNNPEFVKALQDFVAEYRKKNR